MPQRAASRGTAVATIDGADGVLDIGGEAAASCRDRCGGKACGAGRPLGCAPYLQGAAFLRPLGESAAAFGDEDWDSLIWDGQRRGGGRLAGAESRRDRLHFASPPALPAPRAPVGGIYGEGALHPQRKVQFHESCATTAAAPCCPAGLTRPSFCMARPARNMAVFPERDSKQVRETEKVRRHGRACCAGPDWSAELGGIKVAPGQKPSDAAPLPRSCGEVLSRERAAVQRPMGHARALTGQRARGRHGGADPYACAASGRRRSGIWRRTRSPVEHGRAGRGPGHMTRAPATSRRSPVLSGIADRAKAPARACRPGLGPALTGAGRSFRQKTR